MADPISAVEAAINVIQAEIGFENMVNTNDPVTQLNELAQIAAGVSNLINSPLTALVVNGSAALTTIAKMELDAQEGRAPSAGDWLSLAGNLLSMAAALAIQFSPVGRAAGILAKVGFGLGLGQVLVGGIAIATAGDFSSAQRAVFRRDPLTFDLDGDGLETVSAAQSGVFFDHNGDGIREGTGWVRSDDGFLVLDRNGNGTIDTGAELFGDSTPLASGGNAADGFAALAQEDTNADGVVNASDARFADLRIWRDLNQDGLSQSGELFTLSELGIASINVAAAEHSHVLSDGNRIADLGTYTRTDGSTGTTGNVGDMADIDLSVDTFHRQFTTTIPLAVGVTALPNMQASGKVRDLWEAASQSPDLYASLATYSAATTRAGQLSLLDDLVGKWGASAGRATMEERATGALATGQNPFGYGLKWESVGTKRAGDFVTGHGPGNEPIYDPEWIATVQQFEKELYILEAFNGRYFFTFPWETPEGAAAIEGMRVDAAPTDPNTGAPLEAGGIHLNLSQAQIDLLDQSYQALKASVYDSLILQTRFKPLLDSIDLVIGANGGVTLDITAVQTSLQNRLAQDTGNYAIYQACPFTC